MQDLKRIQSFIQKRINKKKKAKKKEHRKYTDLELFDCLRRLGGNKRISETEYLSKKQETDPSTTLFYKRFGSFNRAIEMIYGAIEDKSPTDVDEIYLVKLVIEYNIKTSQEYLEKQSKYPYLFPTQYYVFKLFKNYGNLFACAKRFSISDQIMQCLKVKLSIGKSPTWEDYRQGGLNVSLLKKTFIKLSSLNKKVRLLEEGYEIRRRNHQSSCENDGNGIKEYEKEVFESFAGQLRV